MTTFVAATLYNVPAGLRLHSFSESVNFASLSLFGLISLFHFIFSYNRLIIFFNILYINNVFVNLFIKVYALILTGSTK